jgi:hypothetical protein
MVTLLGTAVVPETEECHELSAVLCKGTEFLLKNIVFEKQMYLICATNSALLAVTPSHHLTRFAPMFAPMFARVSSNETLSSRGFIDPCLPGNFF